MSRSNYTKWPVFGEDEIDAVASVLRSGKVNYWTGEQVRTFEKEFASFHGRSHAIALANGTLALELALRAVGVQAGDEVIVPSRTFIATASAAVAVGARPVVADVDEVSGNISAESIRRVLSSRTRAIIVVHLAGWPCDMDAIMTLASERELKVVEDCAQAHGATYKDRLVGTFGDAAAFSFCQDKIMTTGGEGGMFLTDDPKAWRLAWSYKDHGKNPDKVFAGEPQLEFRWLHDSFGSNWRMTEMQAAIGRIQFKKLPAWLDRRSENAGVLSTCFRGIPLLRVVDPPDHVRHAYYKYYVYLRPENLGGQWTRNRIIKMINARQVPCYSGSCGEIYLERSFQEAGFAPPDRLETARTLGETSLMFLVHPTLRKSDMLETCRVVEQVLKLAGA